MIEEGDHVKKKSGYKWPGVIVSKFLTTAGETRFVVECTARACAGALHIYNEGQLVLVRKRSDRDARLRSLAARDAWTEYRRSQRLEPT